MSSSVSVIMLRVECFKVERHGSGVVYCLRFIKFCYVALVVSDFFVVNELLGWLYTVFNACVVDSNGLRHVGKFLEPIEVFLAHHLYGVPRFSVAVFTFIPFALCPVVCSRANFVESRQLFPNKSIQIKIHAVKQRILSQTHSPGYPQSSTTSLALSLTRATTHGTYNIYLLTYLLNSIYCVFRFMHYSSSTASGGIPLWLPSCVIYVASCADEC